MSEVRDTAHWQRVMTQLAEGRLPHALLLAGPRGAGKLAFAQTLAAHLVCEAAAGASKPCGECRGCTQRLAGTHPNLMRLAPAEDKRDISIDDIRDLLGRLTLSAHYGGYKIAIVAPADALNASGANALLKTIEEPPAKTHILLVSERWRALPATLRSRCQILRFALSRQVVEPAPAEDVAQWERAFAELGQGRFSPLQRVAGFKRDQAQEVLERFLRLGGGWLQALTVPGAGGKVLPPNATTESVQRLIDDSLEGLRALERNASPVLLLESIMIRWAGARPAR